MTWPRKTTMYLSSSKDYCAEVGAELGLSEEAMQTFVYALYEVKFEMEVNEDGTYKILNVKG